MNCQRFHIKICIKLQAVTCPGVWLCSHGYLEVTIRALGYFFRTGALEPYFPLLCHDHFKMEGYFKDAHLITLLINNLNKEPLEITLWQSGRRLSYYQGVIMDLLQYIEPKLHCPHTNTTQLLMKTTPAFPGIIAPKVEVSAQFHIEDKILKNHSNTNADFKPSSNIIRNSYNISKSYNDTKPKIYQKPCTLQPEIKHDFKGQRKQRTVCHTRDYKNYNNFNSNSTDSVLYSNSTERRVSITSSCFSNNTKTSVDICDIERNCTQNNMEYHNHDQCCELCRLYKKVFQQ